MFAPFEIQNSRTVHMFIDEDLDKHDAKIRADAIEEVSRAMYHQCFERNNDENMHKWDSGNWFRYKLFENVIEQLKEQNNGEK